MRFSDPGEGEAIAVGGVGLTERERRALGEIEAGLRHHRRLDRRLRSLGSPSRRPWRQATFGPRCQAAFMTAASIASICLLIVGVRTGELAILGAFAGVCTATVLSGARLLVISARNALRAP
ncbi:hypothetical protein [Streptomyces sp. SID13588]|uniref:hypothetical protein n=1 Tax=Streptomyces sp. SID13588 TaxID=2706051 RepID=UPI0013CDA282|nr:hypothetical protein [Streptomyces sp. SID13588]NEA77147.1 hypothetical protein [Streptomyces sp. SID13588]